MSEGGVGAVSAGHQAKQAIHCVSHHVDGTPQGTVEQDDG
jgi:hypothetical protein